MRRIRLAVVLWFASTALLAGCDDYPRDPNDTLETVAGGTMRVGLATGSPWVMPESDPPGGVSVGLIRELADALDADVTWFRASETEVLEALARGQLDLVAGGLTSDNPWRTHVAFTRPFYRERIVVAAPEPTPLDDLDGVAVAVTPGSLAAALVEARGGIAAPPDAATGYEAKPGWQLGASEHPVLELETRAHVFAVPQGENAWLIAIDRFLSGRRDAVRAALEAAE